MYRCFTVQYYCVYIKRRGDKSVHDHKTVKDMQSCHNCLAIFYPFIFIVALNGLARSLKYL